MTSVQTAAKIAREASIVLGGLTLEQRNAALEAMARAVDNRREEILAENAKDLAEAEKLVAQGKITAAAAKRLNLQGAKLEGVIESLRSVASLPDPLNQTQMGMELDEGLLLHRVSCPIGVIAMIFESRPDALPQIASLCLKSGNAVLLKGGSEALNSNRMLARVLDEAAATVEGIPAGWIYFMESREEVAEILALDEYVDLIIPRGSNSFVRYIMDNTRIPVTGHRDGICHTYIHEAADPEKAVAVTVDGKCQYPAVCNATETLLIDAGCAETILPQVVCGLYSRGVELRVDDRARKILEDFMEQKGQEACGEKARSCKLKDEMQEATEEDWKTEYLELILAIRVVEGLEEAVSHINTYGSHHTDCIVTEDDKAAERFIQLVDSSSVLHNASTRFADGFRYGLGAEVGISTEKIHSRGPVGLEGLTIYKYILRGKGQTVAQYSGAEGRKFTHRPLL